MSQVELDLPRTARAGVATRWLRERLTARLQGLEAGAVTLCEGTSRRTLGRGPLHATLVVRDPRFYRAVAFGGSIGAAEAFMDGWWNCDDLVSLVRILVRERDLLDGFEKGPARIAQPLRKLVHWLNRNTRTGSRRNIAAHYDLGNDFFELFLDPTLTYSCGIFERPDSTLEEASRAKNDRICRKLELSPKDHVLEIGSGWGAFAIHAASRYGCRVTTTTISREQHDLASRRIEAAGLADRITLLLQDYRELEGRYTKIVSIEMIEAVGHRFYGDFFRTGRRLLEPDGQMLVQAITVLDHFYDACRREVDFIKRYIFPGSCIPSVAALTDAAAKSTDLRLTHLEDLTPHYAETLRRWTQNFLRNRERIAALGYPESFLRMWEFYLAYCEGGFRERFLGDVHLIFAAPQCRREPILPPL